MRNTSEVNPKQVQKNQRQKTVQSKGCTVFAVKHTGLFVKYGFRRREFDISFCYQYQYTLFHKLLYREKRIHITESEPEHSNQHNIIPRHKAAYAGY